MKCLRTILNVPILPVEFQEVEHIESTGTQYIDTNFIPTVNSKMELVMACMNTSLLQNWSGVTLNAAAGYFRAGAFSDDNLNALFSVGSRQGVLTFPFDNNFHTYYISNGLQKIDNVEAYNTISNFTGQMVNVYLFKGNATYAYNPDDKQRIKSCKLWNGDTLVRDFVPCYRKSDNVFGMYDLANGVFYTNAGTGDFIKGNDVNRVISSVKSQFAYSILPSEYKQLEYIESTGTQYIDTGIVGKYGLSTYAKLIVTDDASANAVLLGSRVVEGSTNPTRIYLGYRQFNGTVNIGYKDELTSNVQAEKDVMHIYEYSLIDGSAKIKKDGVEIFSQSIDTDFNNGANLFIFANNYINSVVGSYLSCKLYALKIYDNNILVRNYIPAQRISGNEIGLYDRVNGVFYINAGTGSFTAGSEVEPTLISSNTLRLSISELPNAYQEVEWIKSNEKAYINPSANITADIGFEVTANIPSGTQGALLGNYLPESYFFFVYSYTNNTTNFFPEKNANTISMSVPRDSKTTFSFKNGILDDGTTQTEVPSYATAEVGQPIYLFSGRPNNWFASYKLYRCVIYNGSTVERDLRPCYRKSDNEIGLYDVINDVFYTNAGSGYFTKGNDF